MFRDTLVEQAELTIGSSSAIFACGAARLGLKVAFIGVCGDDGRVLAPQAEHDRPWRRRGDGHVPRHFGQQRQRLDLATATVDQRDALARVRAQDERLGLLGGRQRGEAGADDDVLRGLCIVDTARRRIRSTRTSSATRMTLYCSSSPG